MATKGHGVRKIAPLMGEFKPQSTMSLEGQHATTVKAQNIGQKVQMMVTGTKMSHSMQDGGGHSAHFKIHSVKMTDDDTTSGPNTKGAKNDEEGSNSSQ